MQRIWGWLLAAGGLALSLLGFWHGAQARGAARERAKRDAKDICKMHRQHGHVWTPWRRLMVVAPMMIVSGCQSAGVSEGALCAGLARPTTEHAAALANDGGDQSVVTGARLIRLIDAGCQFN